MTKQTIFSGTPEDLKQMMIEVIKPLIDQIRDLQIQELQIQVSHRKHAYTVAEVAEQISCHAKTVYEFIHQGRKARNGRIIRLSAKKITDRSYRILPADLDEFLSHF